MFFNWIRWLVYTYNHGTSKLWQSGIVSAGQWACKVDYNLSRGIYATQRLTISHEVRVKVAALCLSRFVKNFSNCASQFAVHSEESGNRRIKMEQNYSIQCRKEDKFVPFRPWEERGHFNNRLCTNYGYDTNISHGQITITSKKGRRRRTIYSNEQLKYMEDKFASSHFVTASERYEIATILGLTEEQVKVWFQNRRIKLRKSKQES